MCISGWHLPVCAVYQQTHPDTPINDLTKPSLPSFILLKSNPLNVFSVVQLTVD